MAKGRRVMRKKYKAIITLELTIVADDKKVATKLAKSLKPPQDIISTDGVALVSKVGSKTITWQELDNE